MALYDVLHHSRATAPALTGPSPLPTTTPHGGGIPTAVAGAGSDWVSYTYGQMHDAIRRTITALHEGGYRPGDVVALIAPNGPEFAIVFHALLGAGCVVTPIPAYATAADREDAVRLVGARHVLDEAAISRLRGTAVRCAPQAPTPAADEALACLALSSGTTAAPKAVRLSHGNLAANTRQFAAVVPVAADDTVLSVLPLSHIYGLTATLTVPLHTGAHVVTMPFAKDSFLSAHGHFGVGVTFIAPPLAPLMAAAGEEVDFSALHHIISGAAALPAAHGSALAARTGARVLQGYGMTEASPVTHLSVRDTTPIDAIGDPLPHTEARIVTPGTTTDVTDNEVGELIVRGPQVMGGYHNDPDATAATLVDGWLRTGDLACRAEDGSFNLQGRLKDIVTSKGVQVSPTKVEARLLQAGLVEDCVVLAGEIDGEECPVVAYVGSSTPQELLTAAAEILNPFERPRAAYPIDQVPRSAAGKVLRRVLQEQLGL